MNSYFLESEDYVAIENEIEGIIKKEKFNDASISTYDLEETTLDNALEDLDTYTFLSSRKIVIIKNIEAVNEKEENDSIEHLLKYIENPNPDNLLIIETKGFKSKKKENEDNNKKDKKSINLEKELKKKCKTIEIEINSKSFIKSCFKGYDISQATINLLDEYCLEDITKIKSEADKLKNYKIDEKKITEDDIKELVVKKLGDPRDLTFKFTRCLGERDRKNALACYKELLKYNIEPLQVIGNLASQIRIIYQVKILDKRYLSSKDMANMLDEKEFRIKKTRELIPYYSENDLLKLMQKLSDIDLRIKTTNANPNDEIELFITNI